MIVEFAKRTGISMEKLLGKSRRREIVEARQLYWYLLFQEGFSYQEIGELNGRVRSTIYFAVQKVEFLLQENDPVFSQMYDKVTDLRR